MLRDIRPRYSDFNTITHWIPSFNRNRVKGRIEREITLAHAKSPFCDWPVAPGRTVGQIEPVLSSPCLIGWVRAYLCVARVIDKVRDPGNEILRIFSKRKVPGFIDDNHSHMRILFRD